MKRSEVLGLLAVATLIAAVFGLPAGALLQRLSTNVTIDLAAWTQAIGSIVGIAVAIYVPWKIHRREIAEKAQERRLEAQGMAILLIPEITELLNVIASETTTTTLIPPKPLPPVLARFLDRMYILGETGGHLLVIAVALQSDARALDAARRNIRFRAPTGRALRSMQLERMNQLRHAARDAISGLQGIIDSKPTAV